MQSAARQASKMLLPVGRAAVLRNLEYSEELRCWTVRCGGCGEDLPCDDEFFHRDGRGPASHCRACRSERDRSWYQRRGRAMRQAGREAAHG